MVILKWQRKAEESKCTVEQGTSGSECLLLSTHSVLSWFLKAIKSILTERWPFPGSSRFKVLYWELVWYLSGGISAVPFVGLQLAWSYLSLALLPRWGIEPLIPWQFLNWKRKGELPPPTTSNLLVCVLQRGAWWHLLEIVHPMTNSQPFQSLAWFWISSCFHTSSLDKQFAQPLVCKMGHHLGLSLCYP